ncbi:MAG: hypothetical protein IKQ16_00045 [Lentisphaeria bacterium]|jgi:V/A-type H+-transporting ATPase subunit E|nr:hypothetical protein [Lentisphaeria bacterium]
MSEELQGLLNKIQAEGLEKAETERARLVAEAKAQADKIIADAKAQADKIRKDAEADAEASRKKADAAVRQAARDVIISLKDDLQEKLRAVVREAAAQAMTPEAMAGLIAQIAGQFAKNASGAEVILSVREREDAAQKLIGCLPDILRKNASVQLGRGFAAGFKIGFNDTEVFLDFSDEALADVICEFVGPKLAAVIKA